MKLLNSFPENINLYIPKFKMIINIKLDSLATLPHTHIHCQDDLQRTFLDCSSLKKILSVNHPHGFWGSSSFTEIHIGLKGLAIKQNFYSIPCFTMELDFEF